MKPTISVADAVQDNGALRFDTAQFRLVTDASPIKDGNLVIAVGVPHVVGLRMEGLSGDSEVGLRLVYTPDDAARVAVDPDSLRVSVGSDSDQMNNPAFCKGYPDNSSSTPSVVGSSTVVFTAAASTAAVTFCATAPLELRMRVDLAGAPVNLGELLEGDGLGIRAERRAVIVFRPQPLDVQQGAAEAAQLMVRIEPEGILEPPDGILDETIHARGFVSIMRVFLRDAMGQQGIRQGERPLFGEGRESDFVDDAALIWALIWVASTASARRRSRCGPRQTPRLARWCTCPTLPR